MAFDLTPRDIERLKGVHPDLMRVVRRAAQLSPVEFRVLEGVRTLERQKALVATGASKTLNSRHLTGHAVDIAPFVDEDADGDREITWHAGHYDRLMPWIRQAAELERVRLTWGGTWPKLVDKPHWELDRSHYPA